MEMVRSLWQEYFNLIGFVSGYLIGVLIVAIFTAPGSLDALSKLFGIIGSLSIFIALVTYRENKQIENRRYEEGKLRYALEAILDFKDVIKQYDEICRKNGIAVARAPFDENTKFEASSLLTLITPEGVVYLLNELEYFSIKVIQTEAEKHPAIVSVVPTFLIIIETFKEKIFSIRNHYKSNVYYENSLKLYYRWVKDNPK